MEIGQFDPLYIEKKNDWIDTSVFIESKPLKEFKKLLDKKEMSRDCDITLVYIHSG